MRIDPKRLFLIDGLGALFTSIALLVMGSQLTDIIKMPTTVLYALAAQAIMYAIYSISMYVWFPKNWRSYLKGIAIANLVYCIITMSLVGYYYYQLSLLGVLYFAGEVIIIISLAVVEWRVAKSKQVEN